MVMLAVSVGIAVKFGVVISDDVCLAAMLHVSVGSSVASLLNVE